MKQPKHYRMYQYDRHLLPNKHLAKLEEGTTNIDEAIKKTGFSVGYPGWNLLYYSLLCSMRENEFNTIIETGTNQGSSTILLGQALKDSGYSGAVFSVEIEQDNYHKALKNIKVAGLSDYVNLYIDDSLNYLSSFKPKDGKITFAFLDGCHDENHVVKEFELIHTFLDHRSMVFFDNTYLISEDKSNRRVNGALRQIFDRFGGNIINFENTSWYTTGQAIWQRAPFENDWK